MVRPASNPSRATISSITSCGTGASVVITITASRVGADVVAVDVPDGGRDDVDAVLAEMRPDAADHPGHVAVAEHA